MGAFKEKDKYTLSFVGRGELFKTSTRVVCDTEAYDQEILKEIFTIISIFIAIKKIGHDFILSAIFQTLPP